MRGDRGGGGDDHDEDVRRMLSAYRRVTCLERNSTDRSLHTADFRPQTLLTERQRFRTDLAPLPGRLDPSRQHAHLCRDDGWALPLVHESEGY